MDLQSEEEANAREQQAKLERQRAKEEEQRQVGGWGRVQGPARSLLSSSQSGCATPQAEETRLQELQRRKEEEEQARQRAEAAALAEKEALEA